MCQVGDKLRVQTSEPPGPKDEVPHRPLTRCRILDEDPDLGAGLSDEDRIAAARVLVAPVLEVTGPRWQPPEYDPQTAFGLLVLDGLLGRRLRVGRAAATSCVHGRSRYWGISTSSRSSGECSIPRAWRCSTPISRC